MLAGLAKLFNPGARNDALTDAPVSRSVTPLGQLALAYLNGTQQFPADCPDPRVDAEKFNKYCRAKGWA